MRLHWTRVLYAITFSLAVFSHARVLDASPPGVLPPNVLPLRRLTPGYLGLERADFGDPSPPDFSDPAHVQITTTGAQTLIWDTDSGATATEHFFRGDRPRLVVQRLLNDDGSAIDLDPWDVTIEHFPEFGNARYLLAGVMTPPPGEREARWPEDNWRRRVNTFSWDKGARAWRRIADSFEGDPPDQPTWIGHSYGHQILRDGSGQLWAFYERVTEEQNQTPWKTELFAQRLLSPSELDDHEIPIFKAGDSPWPAERRRSGGTLVEGARPFHVGSYYVLSFSAGEFDSDGYGIHLLWSTSITGPYQPYLNEDGTDLKDFLHELKDKYQLTAAGRGAFFQYAGRWWVVFHGIDRRDPERVDGTQRELFLAPVVIDVPVGEPPQIRLQDSSV